MAGLIKGVVKLSIISILLSGCVGRHQTSEVDLSATPQRPQVVIVSANPINTATIAVSTPKPAFTAFVTSTLDPSFLTQQVAVSQCNAEERAWYSKHLSSTFYEHGEWAAVVCSDDGIYTKLWNNSHGQTWNVPAFDEDTSTPEPSWYWIPYLWSQDGNYLYLQPVCLCSIDSPWLLYSSGFGIARLDLASGRFDIWLQPDEASFYSFAFDQQGTLFAFSPHDLKGIIKIRKLLSGDEQTLSFKDKYAILEYRWTSDGSRLVILTEEYDVDPSKNGFSVFVYSLRTDALKKLLDKDNLNFSFPTEQAIEPRIYMSELSDDLLSLQDIYQENNFQLNIRTGELISVKE